MYCKTFVLAIYLKCKGQSRLQKRSVSKPKNDIYIFFVPPLTIYQLQSTLAVRTARYNGHLNNMDSS